MVNKRINKIVRILTFIFAILTLVFGSFGFLIPIYLVNKYKMTVNQNSSIGIIGGADGPTAIFISNQSSYSFTTLIFFIITLSGVIYQIYSKKLKK